jgi:hypothetical protein
MTEEEKICSILIVSVTSGLSGSAKHGNVSDRLPGGKAVITGDVHPARVEDPDPKQLAMEQPVVTALTLP